MASTMLTKPFWNLILEDDVSINNYNDISIQNILKEATKYNSNFIQLYTNDLFLKKQRENLEIYNEYFCITLSFNNTIERLKITFNSLISFMDPYSMFGLQIRDLKLSSDKKNTFVDKVYFVNKTKVDLL